MAVLSTTDSVPGIGTGNVLAAALRRFPLLLLPPCGVIRTTETVFMTGNIVRRLFSCFPWRRAANISVMFFIVDCFDQLALWPLHPVLCQRFESESELHVFRVTLWPSFGHCMRC